MPSAFVGGGRRIAPDQLIYERISIQEYGQNDRTGDGRLEKSHCLRMIGKSKGQSAGVHAKQDHRPGQSKNSFSFFHKNSSPDDFFFYYTEVFGKKQISVGKSAEYNNEIYEKEYENYESHIIAAMGKYRI